eukprot:s3806_g4.t1
MRTIHTSYIRTLSCACRPLRSGEGRAPLRVALLVFLLSLPAGYTGGMSVLYLTCDLDGVVFTFTAAEEKSTWQFSRLSDFHRDNGKDRFVMRQACEGSTTRWVLENQSGQPSVFGTPKYSGHGPPFRGSPSPPRGMWTVWGCPFVLSDTMPQRDAIPSPFTFEVPFAKMHFHEEGRLGYLDIEVFNVGIEEEHLDEILLTLRKVLVNLAQRPEMVLLLRTDARAAPMPSMRHVRKFLAFIQKEVGTECVLVGRGSAIVLVPSTFLGTAVLRLVQLVQRMLPAPYPQAIVASLAWDPRDIRGQVSGLDESTR